MSTEITTLADGFRVAAALIRMVHGESCADQAGWERVAMFLEDVAAVPPVELCPHRRERAVRVLRLALGAREPVAVEAFHERVEVPA